VQANSVKVYVVLAQNQGKNGKITTILHEKLQRKCGNIVQNMRETAHTCCKIISKNCLWIIA